MGPTPRRWCQVFEERKLLRDDGGKKPGRRGERVISRKAIARGVPGDSGVTCMLVCATTTIIAHETAGASGARHSLRPHFGEGGKRMANLGRSAPRECGLTSPSLRGALLSAEARLEAKADATKQSILSLLSTMDCFAEPVIGRAFARPVGSQ